MALNTLDSLMITVTVLALVGLLSLAVYTWIKWRRKQLHLRWAREFTHTAAEPMELPTYHRVTVPNDIDSPNVSGSRRLLSEEVVPHPPESYATDTPAQSNQVM